MASIHESERFLPSTVTPPHPSQGHHFGFLRSHSSASPLPPIFAPPLLGMAPLVLPHSIILSCHTPLHCHSQSPHQPHPLWQIFFPRTLGQETYPASSSTKRWAALCLTAHQFINSTPSLLSHPCCGVYSRASLRLAIHLDLHSFIYSR